jgi:16S rRNA (guanine966-N2)-methyltransferase
MRITSGTFKNFSLVSPKGDAVRPTQEQVRSAIFNMIGDFIIDKTFLDLFAGSGAVGLEALSRGAEFITFIEKDRLALTALKSNIEKLKCESKVKIYPQDTIKVLKKFIQDNRSFDFLFLDPPYDDDKTYETILELIDNSSLLDDKGTVFVEERVQKKGKNDSAFNHLVLIDKRSYGSTIIKQYKRSL